MYYSQSDIAIIKLLLNKAELDTAQLKAIIDEDNASDEKARMNEGEAYYDFEHDILNRKITYWDGLEKKEDPSKANNRLVNAFHTLLVNQKTDYAVGNAPVLKSEDDKLNKLLKQTLGKKFATALTELVIGASNKGVEWLQYYIDEKGNFQYAIIDSKQIIAIYDSQFDSKLLYIIRYYHQTITDTRGSEQEILKVEWWDKSSVTYYTEENGLLVPEVDESGAVDRGHYYTYNSLNPDAKIWQKGFSDEPPFIPLWNNVRGTTDLQPTKPLLDAYDKLESDGVNNFEDLQEMIYVLKGYEGERDENNVPIYVKFLDMLKTYKTLFVKEDGEVDTLKTEIPMEARKTMLKELEENIFAVGCGVNMKTDKFGGNPSGVALQLLYKPLDAKVNSLYSQLELTIGKLIEAIARYLVVSKKGTINPDEVEIVFKKSIIVNELEEFQKAQMSKGIISDKTIVSHNPWVKDVEKEIKQLEEQNSVNLDDVNLNDPEEMANDANKMMQNAKQ